MAMSDEKVDLLPGKREIFLAYARRPANPLVMVSWASMVRVVGSLLSY